LFPAEPVNREKTPINAVIPKAAHLPMECLSVSMIAWLL
jgi:hypothetical protein